MAIAFKPSTLLYFHRTLVKQKYRLLFSPKHLAKPGPKGPMAELIRAVVEMKQRNQTWGCPRIAEQINLAFGTSINKDVVRRILALHYRPAPDSDGPSWLTFLGHMKDSLWSLDLFRCESAGLRSYWVLVVSTKNLILPEITRLEAVRSEVDVAICDLGVVTMGSFSVRCRTRPFEGR
jgi:hypothetical protein